MDSDRELARPHKLTANHSRGGRREIATTNLGSIQATQLTGDENSSHPVKGSKVTSFRKVKQKTDNNIYDISIKVHPGDWCIPGAFFILSKNCSIFYAGTVHKLYCIRHLDTVHKKKAQLKLIGVT